LAPIYRKPKTERRNALTSNGAAEIQPSLREAILSGSFLEFEGLITGSLGPLSRHRRRTITPDDYRGAVKFLEGIAQKPLLAHFESHYFSRIVAIMNTGGSIACDTLWIGAFLLD
jgi:hypothetical protein